MATFPWGHLIEAGSKVTVNSRLSPEGSDRILFPRSTENPESWSRWWAVVKDTGQWPTFVRWSVREIIIPNTMNPRLRWNRGNSGLSMWVELWVNLLSSACYSVVKPQNNVFYKLNILSTIQSCLLYRGLIERDHTVVTISWVMSANRASTVQVNLQGQDGLKIKNKCI